MKIEEYELYYLKKINRRLTIAVIVILALLAAGWVHTLLRWPIC